MRTVNLAPLYRSFIGFDHLASLMDVAAGSDKTSGYPAYNIELLADDKYLITMAVAGFVASELSIETEQNLLKVSGLKAETAEEKTARRFIHQGLTQGHFERKFQLGDHIKVTTANVDNGLLYIELAKETPEALKPRKIAIGSSALLANLN